MHLAVKAAETQDSNIASLTATQNRAILIAGLTCACFSLAVSVVTLRWFILMRRQFRHRLVLLLIASDTFKAIWYFIFPVVSFTNGPILSSSAFCQTSGFFLALAVEASDVAILFIALHSILYIFHPPASSAHGGLHPWQKWVYSSWLVLPVIFASLAFVNSGPGYTTAGTFCYLPKRPFWYRLALSWVPRYIILVIIFVMFAAVYIYVGLKFKSFASLGKSDSMTDSGSYSRRSSLYDLDIGPDEMPPEAPPAAKRNTLTRPVFSRASSQQRETEKADRPRDPWDEVSFITAKPLRTGGSWQAGISAADFATRAYASDSSEETRIGERNETPSKINSAQHSRKASACPTTDTRNTDEMAVSMPVEPVQQAKHKHHNMLHLHHQHTAHKTELERTRSAIRRQLRYMFIYPVVYVLMWIFPFVSHCLLYSDWYAERPIFWLQVMQSVCLALQAAADCIVFSWREKPWSRISDDSKYTVTYWRNSFSLRHDPEEQQNSKKSSLVIAPEDYNATRLDSLNTHRNSGPSTLWWEAEGRKRKDSVWLGLDTHNVLSSPIQEVRSNETSAPVDEHDEEDESGIKRMNRADKELSPDVAKNENG